MHQNDTFKLDELIERLEQHRKLYGGSSPVFVTSVIKKGKIVSALPIDRVRWGGPGPDLPKGILLESVV